MKIEIYQPNTLLRELGSSFLIFFAISLIFSLVVFFPGLNNYFASDDWPAIFRNSTFSWEMLPEWFTTLRAGWYRPIHDLFINLCWRLFDFNPIGYRLVTIFVYALVSASVGVLMTLLTSDRRVSLAAVMLFSGFATHAEPVLWFAATNELLAGLFVLLSVISHILYRKINGYGWIFVSVIFGFLAFAAKETALFFPILLIIFDLLSFFEHTQEKKSWSFFLPFLPMALFWMGFLLFRIPMGSSYSSVVDVTPFGIIKNLIYYLSIGILLLPNNYAFLSALPLWQSSPELPLIILVVSVSIISLLGFTWWRTGLWTNKKHQRNLIFTITWIFSALGPVIFIVTERAVFLSSIGIVLLFSILLVKAWDAAQTHHVWLKRSVAFAFVLYLGINIYVLSYRTTWFKQSADLNYSVLEQLEQATENLPPNARISLVNLPDHTQFTFTFRNTFPSATRLLQWPLHVTPILDNEIAGKSRQDQDDYINRIIDQTKSEFVFWYEDGRLFLQQ